ncbi:MAG: dihydrofolate reductase [Phycisphaerae bacterium]|nr:dihydrofolate reductase [Phycisphaerae bacterium]
MMRISLIAAMSPDRIIGCAGALPWHFPEDLKHFRQLTLNHCVLMGRKTYSSLSRPLPQRRNLVISRQAKPADTLTGDGVEWFNEISDAIQWADRQGETELFVAGGGEIYTATLNLANRMYLTIVHPEKPVSGDTWFPAWDAAQWTAVERKESIGLEFIIYDRRAETKPQAAI